MDGVPDVLPLYSESNNRRCCISGRQEAQAGRAGGQQPCYKRSGRRAPHVWTDALEDAVKYSSRMVRRVMIGKGETMTRKCKGKGKRNNGRDV